MEVGNKLDYNGVYIYVRKHKNYIRDYEDSLDNTYTYFEFEIPDKYKSTTNKMKPTEDRLSVGDLFKKEIEEARIPGSPAAKRQEEIAEWIMKNIIEGNNIIEL